MSGGMKKNSSGVLVDMETLKNLVGPPVSKLNDKVEKEGSVRLLPGVKRKRGSSFRQVCAALSANLGTVNTGMGFGFSAVALPKLLLGENGVQIDDSQSSWIASLSAMSTPVGCILSGCLMDLLGRKRILIATQIPLIAGWLLIGTAKSVAQIYVGRLILGLGTGMVGAPSRVYTAEATQPHLRGMLSALASVGVSFGVLLEYLIGWPLSWNNLALVSSIIPMLALILSCFLPESPSWLMTQGKQEKSRKCLEKLRGSTCDVDHEVNQLISFSQKNNLQNKPTLKETLNALIDISALKPFGIIVTYFLIYQWSGVNPVTFYAVEIFQESEIKLDKNLATVLLGIVRVFFTIVGCILMRKCGRRPLTFVSSIGCGLTMIGLGIYLYYLKNWKLNEVEPQYTWLPVFFINVFMIVSTIGYLIVPWVMIGEVYPTRVRGIIGGLTTCCGHFFVFKVVKSFKALQQPHVLDKHGTFMLYGVISLLGTIFFYFCLPETKGKTLQEIEDYFSGRTKSLTNRKNGIVKTNNSNPTVLVVNKGNVLP